jgi:hypothetical protein
MLRYRQVRHDFGFLLDDPDTGAAGFDRRPVPRCRSVEQQRSRVGLVVLLICSACSRGAPRGVPASLGPAVAASLGIVPLPRQVASRFHPDTCTS